MSNFFDNGGFFWWTGVVEDRNDPLFLGRCRVRIVGYHNSSRVELPTEDLPWTQPIQPITSAAMTGIGHTPVGPVEGTWVVGFFADGADQQEPFMFGTISGIPQTTYYNSIPDDQGFVDKTKTYPITELLDEPDTNRLARGIRTPFVDDKDTHRATGVVLSRGQGSWDQPPSPFGAIYPFNQVFASESGHIQEFDDTEGAERINTHHAMGTFTEIDRNGTRVTRIVGDEYEVMERNGFLFVRGKMNVTINGSCNIYVKTNCNLQVDGDMSVDVHKDYNLNVAGNMKTTVGGDILTKSKGKMKNQSMSLDIKSDTSINIESGTTMGLKAGTTMFLRAVSTFAVTAITAAINAIFQQLNLTVSSTAIMTASSAQMAVGIVSTPSVPSPVNLLSPTEPHFSSLGFTLTTAQRKSFAVEKIRAYEAANDKEAPPEARQAAKEYVALKEEELSTDAVVSAPVKADEVVVTPKDYLCAVGLRVVQEATKDVGIIETGTPPGKNYGGKVGGGMLEEGIAGRIDEMHGIAGLDNMKQVRKTGQGYYWCASAVTSWWKAAGLPLPPSPTSCANWEAWGRKNGYFSSTPKVGAAILYGTPGSAHHIGIVSAVDSAGKIRTIEGNTSGGGFSRNGCGVFHKTPRSYIGFIIPPPCA